MRLFIRIQFLFLTIAFAKEDKISYDDIEFLTHNQTWVYFKPVPKSPQQLDVKLFLTNKNLNHKHLPNVGNFPSLEGVKNYLEYRHFTFIVHGFMSRASDKWVRDLENALVKSVKTNVISIDWSKGSRPPNYFQAMANTKTVAFIVSRFIKTQIKYGIMHPEDIHLIGQSLGAHLISYISNRIPGIGFITGLDPAEPGFSQNHPETRLDASDAEYVEVIHTNTAKMFMSLSLGHNEPLGDVDFYINGGSKQPACQASEKGLSSYLASKLSSLSNSISCDHMKAQEYYIEALDSSSGCSMLGIKWDLNNTNIPSNKAECNLGNCQEIGPRGKYLPGRGIFYVATTRKPPYCVSTRPISKEFSNYLEEISFKETNIVY